MVLCLRTGLTHHDLIAMAVMLGCDYMPQGVPGVGKEMAVRVVKEERNMMKMFQQGGAELSGKQHVVLFKAARHLLCLALGCGNIF